MNKGLERYENACVGKYGRVTFQGIFCILLVCLNFYMNAFVHYFGKTRIVLLTKNEIKEKEKGLTHIKRLVLFCVSFTQTTVRSWVEISYTMAFSSLCKCA